MLAFFKYWNFLNDNLTDLLGLFHSENPVPYLQILLPIGLSFHTFQAMSYTIEVYRGNQKPERHFGIYALYVMFFPQLVAGPIERPQNMLHQFHEKHNFSYVNAVAGLRMMLWGLFKKIVIADLLAGYSDKVFATPSDYHGQEFIVAAVFFAFQVYCDFSGYSDIAVGSARVMGFNLIQNFRMPFFSRSLTDLWRRWHISLSTWFFDYLYSPLVNRFRNWGLAGIALALLITFFLSGLWHGAAWAFVVFGLLHSIALIYEVVTRKARKKLSKRIPSALYNAGCTLLTFGFFAYTMVIFRANNLKDSWYITKSMFRFDLSKLGINVNDDKVSLVSSFALIILLLVVERQLLSRPIEVMLGQVRTLPRWSLYVVMVWAILFSAAAHFSNQFIYFQF
ncbi:MAG TPA: MBOAT family O-acyltransferase [Bacteroidia bacterium]|nr:MBOAT family O-acyltransferase [Bacteroidia bacterium]